MKTLLKHTLSASLLLASATTFAQTSAQLDANNIGATINANGFVFNDQTNTFPGFEVPIGSGSHTFYSNYLAVGAVNINGQLAAAVPDFGYDVTWTVGPVMDNYNLMPASFQRVWKVDYADIEYHIGVMDGSITDPSYQTPASLTDWPAHGDVSLGMAFDLAPYIDVDGNGVYEPALGDYPDICGDQAIYIIYNDDNRSNGYKMKVEVHAMFCVFDCDISDALQNSVFGKYRVINRSTQTYYDTWLGQWNDMDVGNVNDDYVATDVERATFYTYNGDDFDETANGVVGYQDNPAAQSATIMKGPLLDFNGVDDTVGVGTGFGDGIIDNERHGLLRTMTYSNGTGGLGGPATAAEFYNFMRGYWQDNTQMVYGGTGHISDPGADPNTPAWYVFPGNSDPTGVGTGGVPQAPWSEQSAATPIGDRRGVASTGGFTFAPDDEATMEIAYVFGQDVNTTGAASGVAVMQDYIDEIMPYCICGPDLCEAIAAMNIQEEVEQLEVAVYPNPMQDQLTIDFQQEGQATYQLFNLLGELVLEGQVSYGRTNISTSNLNAGVYLIQIDQDDVRMTQKLLKQ